MIENIWKKYCLIILFGCWCGFEFLSGVPNSDRHGPYSQKWYHGEVDSTASTVDVQPSRLGKIPYFETLPLTILSPFSHSCLYVYFGSCHVSYSNHSICPSAFPITRNIRGKIFTCILFMILRLGRGRPLLIFRYGT